MSSVIGLDLGSAGRQQLVALRWRCTPRMRLELLYRGSRRERLDTLSPFTSREALAEALRCVEAAKPGALAAAARLDDQDWMNNKRRTRRYLADRADLIYIDSPHLAGQIEEVAGYFVPTNIPRRDVADILRLVCRAAGIEFGLAAAVATGPVARPATSAAASLPPGGLFISRVPILPAVIPVSPSANY